MAIGLVVTACSPAALAGDPLPGVVFVSDDIFGAKHENPDYPRPGTSHWREGYLYHRATTQHVLERTTTPTRPGRNLYTLIPARPDGTLRRITHLSDGEVFDPEPSYDGRRILFSMRRDGEDWFNLYEIGADGTRLVQLTDGPFNDVSGVYLPDGRIVFVSDRAGYLEEYHEERTETLWIMGADGTGIQQLTFNPGTVFDPTVLADGRILFSLWDTFMLNLPPADKHETYLMTVRPDGTEEGHFFGAREHPFFNRERHSGVALTQSGQMPDGTILVQSEMGPSILDVRRGLNARYALWPVFPCTTSLQLGGATHRVHLSPTGSRTTPYPLSDGRFLLAATLPGARDLGIYLADPATRQMELVFNDPETAEFDPRPILLERTLPAALPPKARFAHRDTRGSRHRGRVAVTPRARFVVAAGRNSDDRHREKALARARYYRVVEALHTAVTSSSHTSLATRILGVVPIRSDGSVYFEAPADTPLFLEPVDAAGRRLQFDWRYPETSVPVGSKQILTEMTYITARPGETKACVGCHAPMHESVDPRVSAAAVARGPVRVQRDLTDLVYRRNEPDEYRCQARIGEASKYRPWLESPEAASRRRACELLAAIEDGAERDVEAIGWLLEDESTPVRRAAGRALARLGTPDSVPGLIGALEDADWQVRFHAAAALEAITACTPPGDHDGDSARRFYVELVDRLGGTEGVRKAIDRGPATLEPFAQDDGDELLRRWFEAAGRLGRDASDSARVIVRRALDVPLPPPVTFEPWAGKRHPLEGGPPELGAIRAAGKMQDSESVARLVPWLSRSEYQDHATEAAVALGRIGTPEAVGALWAALREQVPELAPFQSRYLQRGPRPEEYALLRGLILAGAAPAVEDVSLVVAMLPGSFLEKPRYEDRLRPESQRVLLGRLLLENGRLRRRMVKLLVDVLAGRPPATDDPLYAEIVEGINLERPFAEHRRPFPVVKRIEPEQALWFLGCLAVDATEVPERLVLPYLASENWRERIDAAVLLDVLGFGSQGADALFHEAVKPYPFSEIMGIGKSHYDTNFRDKCYMVAALAHHGEDVQRLRTFADPKTRYRDLRYGLAIGLGRREGTDGVELLARLATTDPISAVRREARQSLWAIQERARLAGEPVPPVELGEAMALESWHAPRGLSWPGPVVVRPSSEAREGRAVKDLKRLVTAGLEKKNYRDLNNANNQAPGAKALMIRGIGSFDRAIALLAERDPESALPLLKKMIDSPYPFAHYLALREYSGGAAGDGEQLLIAQLNRFGSSSDTVRFYWACEALAAAGVQTALPELARLASTENPAGLHGPLAVGLGYPAAKALARLAGRIDHDEVRRLLDSENIWLRAGALAGLTEARAPGIERLLRKVLEEHPSGVVFDHARVGLAQLRGRADLRAARPGRATTGTMP
jgi:HEAT repeat protein